MTSSEVVSDSLLAGGPQVRLGAEVLEVCDVIVVKHGDVAAGGAEVRVAFVECLVPPSSR